MTRLAFYRSAGVNKNLKATHSPKILVQIQPPQLLTARALADAEAANLFRRERIFFR
jgi:hypothetical protein